jgi:hypothetical protein
LNAALFVDDYIATFDARTQFRTTLSVDAEVGTVALVAAWMGSYMIAEELALRSPLARYALTQMASRPRESLRTGKPFAGITCPAAYC